MEPGLSEATACGSAAMIWSAGNRQPITPVELGNTSVGFSPRAAAAAAQSFSEVSTPPGAHTLEILLLTMIAPSFGSARRLRPTITGAPGKAFFVNIAAKSAVGLSSAMRVTVIFAGFGTSMGVKSKREAPTRNPRGSAALAASHARCSAREEKTSEVLLMSPMRTAQRRGK